MAHVLEYWQIWSQNQLISLCKRPQEICFRNVNVWLVVKWSEAWDYEILNFLDFNTCCWFREFETSDIDLTADGAFMFGFFLSQVHHHFSRPSMKRPGHIWPKEADMHRTLSKTAIEREKSIRIRKNLQ